MAWEKKHRVFSKLMACCKYPMLFAFVSEEEKERPSVRGTLSINPARQTGIYRFAGRISSYQKLNCSFINNKIQTKMMVG